MKGAKVASGISSMLFLRENFPVLFLPKILAMLFLPKTSPMLLLPIGITSLYYFVL